jgi:hypothetical protein
LTSTDLAAVIRLGLRFDRWLIFAFAGRQHCTRSALGRFRFGFGMVSSARRLDRPVATEHRRDVRFTENLRPGPPRRSGRQSRLTRSRKAWAVTMDISRNRSSPNTPTIMGKPILTHAATAWLNGSCHSCTLRSS